LGQLRPSDRHRSEASEAPVISGLLLDRLREELFDGELGEGLGHHRLEQPGDLELDLGLDLFDDALAVGVEEVVGGLGQRRILATEQVLHLDEDARNVEVDVGVLDGERLVAVGKPLGHDLAESFSRGVGQDGSEGTVALQGHQHHLALGPVKASDSYARHSELDLQGPCKEVGVKIFRHKARQTIHYHVGKLCIDLDGVCECWFALELQVPDVERFGGTQVEFRESL